MIKPVIRKLLLSSTSPFSLQTRLNKITDKEELKQWVMSMTVRKELSNHPERIFSDGCCDLSTDTLETKMMIYNFHDAFKGIDITQKTVGNAVQELSDKFELVILPISLKDQGCYDGSYAATLISMDLAKTVPLEQPSLFKRVL